MQITTVDIERVADDLRALAADDIADLGDAALLRRAAAVEQLVRLADAAAMRTAGEIAHRSRRELGEGALCRAQNFASPVALLGAVTRVSAREARARIDLGLRFQRDVDFRGEVRQPLPELFAGSVSAECAAVIARECGELERRGVGAERVAEAERALVRAATGEGTGDDDPALTGGFGTDEVARLAIRIREHLDPDGCVPREEEQSRMRGLTLARSADGMFRGRLALTPEQGALWWGAAQALLSPRTAPRTAPRFVDVPRSGGSDEDGDASTEADVLAEAARDTRTAPQKLADAMTELVARAAGSPNMPRLAGATTTVNVHITLDDLEAGRGRAWIDGIDEPVPASVVQQLVCHAPVVPTVFGAHGEVLFHGKARRLFSPAQNRALAARDGGCVWPECRRAPADCETHHLVEWRDPDHPPGRTDIDNGVLLCHFHHRHLHRTAWQLVMRDGAPHLRPPRWLDRHRTPVPVGKRRTAAPMLASEFVPASVLPVVWRPEVARPGGDRAAAPPADTRVVGWP